MEANNNQKVREASEQICAYLEPVRKGMVPKGESLLADEAVAKWNEMTKGETK